jgi:hypothetical protein
MIIKIENKDINLSNIKQLYPAAIVKTGYEDETTQVSLEWLEIEAKGKVEVVGFQIFVELKDSEKFSFFYDTKKQLFDSISKISKQIDN